MINSTTIALNFRSCIVLLLLFLCSCTVDTLEDPIYVVEEDEYELIFFKDATHLWYVKIHLVQYFIKVALGSEFGSDLQISKKWLEPMKLFVDGNPTNIHLTEVQLIIDELNELFTDGFQITLVDNADEANFSAYMGTLGEYRSKYFVPHNLGHNSAGYFYNEVNSKFEIIGGHMFVDTENTTLQLQKHLLREELTQALGFGNDIPYYPNSIFYEQWSDVSSFSNYDKEAIRLLYHPRMLPGLSKNSVTSLLESILNIN